MAMRRAACFFLTAATVWGLAAKANAVTNASVVCDEIAAPSTTNGMRIVGETPDVTFFVSTPKADDKNPMGFLAFSKATGKWLLVNAVSTAGGVFGRSPSVEEQQRMKRYAAAGWDFSSLARAKYAVLPLRASSFLAYPDEVSLDTFNGQYNVSFHTGWRVPGVATVLRLKAKDLASAFGLSATVPAKPAPAANAPKAAKTAGAPANEPPGAGNAEPAATNKTARPRKAK